MTISWKKIRARIEAGDYPAVFINRVGKLCLDGSAAQLPPELAAMYPPEVISAAAEKAAAAEAERQAQDALAEAARATAMALRQQVIDQYGAKRCWRLTGLEVMERDKQIYTWQEIMRWVDWDAPNLLNPTTILYAVCSREGQDDFAICISDHFWSPDRNPKPPGFATLCSRLHHYTADKARRMAGNN